MSNGKSRTDPLDENWAWSSLEDLDMFGADETSKKVVEAAKFKARNDYDTNIAGRKHLVCLDCIKGIFSDAGVDVPQTSDINTFMDAVRGYKVQLWNHPMIDGKIQKKDILLIMIGQRYRILDS